MVYVSAVPSFSRSWPGRTVPFASSAVLYNGLDFVFVPSWFDIVFVRIGRIMARQKKGHMAGWALGG